jgi:hypothetical protein
VACGVRLLTVGETWSALSIAPRRTVHSFVRAAPSSRRGTWAGDFEACWDFESARRAWERVVGRQLCTCGGAEDRDAGGAGGGRGCEDEVMQRDGERAPGGGAEGAGGAGTSRWRLSVGTHRHTVRRTAGTRRWWRRWWRWAQTSGLVTADGADGAARHGPYHGARGGGDGADEQANDRRWSDAAAPPGQRARVGAKAPVVWGVTGYGHRGYGMPCPCSLHQPVVRLVVER